MEIKRIEFNSSDYHKELILRDEVLRKLVDIQYERNDINFTRGSFRVRGDIVDIFPASSNENAIRVEFICQPGHAVSRVV